MEKKIQNYFKYSSTNPCGSGDPFLVEQYYSSFREMIIKPTTEIPDSELIKEFEDLNDFEVLSSADPNVVVFQKGELLFSLTNFQQVIDQPTLYDIWDITRLAKNILRCLSPPRENLLLLAIFFNRPMLAHYLIETNPISSFVNTGQGIFSPFCLAAHKKAYDILDLIVDTAQACTAFFETKISSPFFPSLSLKDDERKEMCKYQYPLYHIRGTEKIDGVPVKGLSVFHYAATIAENDRLLERLYCYMSVYALSMRDGKGRTAFHYIPKSLFEFSKTCSFYIDQIPSDLQTLLPSSSSSTPQSNSSTQIVLSSNNLFDGFLSSDDDEQKLFDISNISLPSSSSSSSSSTITSNNNVVPQTNIVFDDNEDEANISISSLSSSSSSSSPLSNNTSPPPEPFSPIHSSLHCSFSENDEFDRFFDGSVLSPIHTPSYSSSSSLFLSQDITVDSPFSSSFSSLSLLSPLPSSNDQTKEDNEKNELSQIVFSSSSFSSLSQQLTLPLIHHSSYDEEEEDGYIPVKSLSVFLSDWKKKQSDRANQSIKKINQKKRTIDQINSLQKEKNQLKKIST